MPNDGDIVSRRQQSPNCCLAPRRRQSAVYRLDTLRVHSLALNSAAGLTANWLMQDSVENPRPRVHGGGRDGSRGRALDRMPRDGAWWILSLSSVRRRTAGPNGLGIWFNGEAYVFACSPVGSLFTVRHDHWLFSITIGTEYHYEPTHQLKCWAKLNY